MAYKNKKLKRCCELLGRYSPREHRSLIAWIAKGEGKWFRLYTDMRIGNMLYRTGLYRFILPILNEPLVKMPLYINGHFKRSYTDNSIVSAVARWRLQVGR